MKKYMVYHICVLTFLGLTPSFSLGMDWFKGAGKNTQSTNDQGEEAVVEVLGGGRASVNLSDRSFHPLASGSIHGAAATTSENAEDQDGDADDEQENTDTEQSTEDNTGNPPTSSLKQRIKPSTNWLTTAKKSLTPNTKFLSYMALAGGVGTAGYGLWRMIRGEEVLGSAGAATGLGVTTATIGAGSLIRIHYIEKPSKKLKD